MKQALGSFLTITPAPPANCTRQDLFEYLDVATISRIAVVRDRAFSTEYEAHNRNGIGEDYDARLTLRPLK